MLLKILTRAVPLLFRLTMWSFLPMVIGMILLFKYLSTQPQGERIDASASISAWGPLLLIALPMVFLQLLGVLYLMLLAARHVDLLFTEPAVGEVISVKRDGVFVNYVPQLTVKMRVKGSNAITECRVLNYVGPDVGAVYNIKISRLNPAVAEIVNPAVAEIVDG